MGLNQKPNCAILQQTLKLQRIQELKKIIKSLKGSVKDRDLYLMAASKYGLSLRKASEYVRIAKYQLAQ